jgi:hypothetical protein
LKIEKAYAEAQEWDQYYIAGKEAFRIWAQSKNSAGPARYGTDEVPWRKSASSSIILVDQTPSMTGA